VEKGVLDSSGKGVGKERVSISGVSCDFRAQQERITTEKEKMKKEKSTSTIKIL